MVRVDRSMCAGSATERPFCRLAHDFHYLRLEVRGLRSSARPVLVKAFFYFSLLAVYLLRRALRGGTAPELHFYPQIPDAEYTIWKVCALLGLRRSRLRPGAKIVYVFDDNDLEPKRVSELTPVIEACPDRTINLRCTDISKTAVARAFEEAFGYGIELDPTTYIGSIVEKSDANARHDGRVIEGPVTTVDPERVYQRVIDNERPTGLVEDIRVPVVGSSVPFVYLKYRPIETRFSNENKFVRLEQCRNVLSSDEVERVLTVCRRMGLDCGELDAVRDGATSRLYILDVNKTCWGPPNHLGLFDCYRATWRLARAFKANFLSPEA
jgi:hypothetical protein